SLLLTSSNSARATGGRARKTRGRKGCEASAREIGCPARDEFGDRAARGGREQDAVAVVAGRVEEVLHVNRLADNGQPVRRARPESRPGVRRLKRGERGRNLFGACAD